MPRRSAEPPASPWRSASPTTAHAASTNAWATSTPAPRRTASPPRNTGRTEESGAERRRWSTWCWGSHLWRRRLAAHREAHRSSDEAKLVGPGMQGLRLYCAASVQQRDHRSQRGIDELPRAVSRLLHHTLRSILVADHGDPGLGAEVEVPEHVALGERGDH